MQNKLIICVLFSVVFSCISNKENNIVPNPFEEAVTSNEIESLSKFLATNNETTLKLLQNVYNEFNQPSNSVLLFSNLPNIENLDHKETTLADLISQELKLSNSRINGIDFGKLKNLNPFLEISLFKDGVEIEDFPLEEDNILVAFPDKTGTKEFIRAYDKNGKMVKLDYWIAPKGFVAVIHNNERLIAVPKNDRAAIKMKPVFQNESSSIFYSQDYYEINNELTIEEYELKTNNSGMVTSIVPSITKSLRPMSCSRDLDNNKDRMNKFKVNSSTVFNDMKDGWFNSTLEIECDITIYSSYGILHLDITWFPKEKDLKDLDWFSMGDVEVFNWITSNFGDVVHYDFYEKDGNNMVPKSISFSTTTSNNQTVTANSTYEVASSRYDLNNSLVQYCDASTGDGHLYNTSKIQFYVRHPF